MCRPVRCTACNKTTWAGCGQHIEQVKAQAPKGQWCTCKNHRNKDYSLPSSDVKDQP